MLNILYDAEQTIAAHFLDYTWLKTDKWNSLDVTYKDPHVQRLWRDFGENRIYLHKIYKCKNPFFHFHPWPSAMKVVAGSYKMNVGYGDRMLDKPPNICLSQIVPARTYYEMLDPNSWHSVNPISNYSLSLMITGRLFDDKSKVKPKVFKRLPSLDESTKKEILLDFCSHMIDIG